MNNDESSPEKMIPKQSDYVEKFTQCFLNRVDADYYVNEHYNLMRFFTQPELEKQSSAAKTSYSQVSAEFDIRQTQQKILFFLHLIVNL